MIEFARENSIFEFAVYPVILRVNNARKEGHDLIGPIVFPSFRSGKAWDTTSNVTSSEEFREGAKKMERPEVIAYESNVIPSHGVSDRVVSRCREGAYQIAPGP